MAARRHDAGRSANRGRNRPSASRYVPLAALIIAVAALALSSLSLYISLGPRAAATGTTATNAIANTVTFGHTLAGINQQLNASALAVINGAPDSYFETAGLMYLNGSINNTVLTNFAGVNSLIVNGRPSVVYLGSITCIFCGENRWAMALALGRFGSFSRLFQGYSSFGDYDVPTLYWHAADYTHRDSLSVSSNAILTGSYYSSSYINFFPIEGQGNLTGGFFIQSLPIIGAEINNTGNSTYIGVFRYILSLQGSNSTLFRGTPYTIWGNRLFAGADAVDFGNSTPASSSLPLTYMTHAQVLSQLASPADQFAWTEYAAADVYIASVCTSINNTAQICSLSAIQKIEALK